MKTKAARMRRGTGHGYWTIMGLLGLAQIKERRYYEPYLTDPRRTILLAAGGFEDRAIRCLWEDCRGKDEGGGMKPESGFNIQHRPINNV